jgi:16S rRNA (uracil1498-N3)-methyltransferase
MARRLHVPPAQLAAADAGRLPLTPEQHRYLAQVLRLGAGDAVEAFDGEGARLACVLEAGPDGALLLRLGERTWLGPGPVDVWLAQALAKADKLELVIQKATELGASRVLPFSAARSVVKLEGERSASKAERWRKIAQEAARQCGRADVPLVDEPLPLRALLALLEQDPGRRGLVLAPDAQAVRLSAAARGEQKLLLVIGPEGGLSPEELEACAQAGVAPVSLGRLVLRTETAGLAALSVVQHLAGALG